MKVVVKTLDVLELIVNHPGKPVTPSVVASKLGINVTTCVRIMGCLTKRGYLRQISRREGYVPGPALFILRGRNQWEYNRVVDAAAGPVRELAFQLNTTVNISTMQHGIKYILYYHRGHSTRRILIQTQYTGDHHRTATGMLLMSQSSEDVQREFYGAQTEDIHRKWDEITDFNSFRKKMQTVRNAGEISYVDKGGLRIIGTMVNLGTSFPAAIGFGYDGEDSAFALRCARETAQRICSQYNAVDDVLR